jgi:hypothetical protein
MKESVEDVFHEVFLKEGGRLILPRNEDVDWLHQYLGFARKQFEKPVDSWTKVYVDYVNSPVFNAEVKYERGMFWVGVNTSFLSTISFLARGLMRSRLLYRGIGAPSAESTDVVEWLGLLTSNLKSIAPVIGSVPFDEIEMKPRDTERNKWAEFFMNWAWRILIHHEAVHVYFNHFDILRSLDGSKSFCEVTNSARVHALSLQALEMEADAVAAACLYAEMEGPLGSDRVAVHAAISAIFWMSILFGAHNVTLEGYKLEDHPHPAIRYVSMMRAVIAERELIRHSRPEVLKLWQDMAASTLGDNIFAASTLNHRSSVMEWFERFATGQSIAAKEIVGNMMIIREELRRLTILRMKYASGS